MSIGHNDVLHSSKSIFNGLTTLDPSAPSKHLIFSNILIYHCKSSEKKCLECLVSRAVISSIITPLGFIFYKSCKSFVSYFSLSQHQGMCDSKMSKLLFSIIFQVCCMPFKIGIITEPLPVVIS